jgi:hypothetical protein
MYTIFERALSPFVAICLIMARFLVGLETVKREKTCSFGHSANIQG